MASKYSRLFFSLTARPVLAAAVALAINACDMTDNNGGGGFQAGDPVAVDYPVAYVERTIPLDDEGELAEQDILDPAAFHPGARLVIKARASASAIERVITDDVFPRNTDGSPALYDVKDLAASPDGLKLVFAMRAPEIPNADDEDQPKWNIWEYDLENDSLRQVIGNKIYGNGTPYQPDLFAEEGHDVAPQYLPDGRIIFSSNRQERGRAILLDENKPQYHGLDDQREEESYSLHVMDADGENRLQITFNASQDLQPTVLDSGDIVFLRRDGIGNHDRLSLYRAKPDGSNLELYYGYHTQNTGTNESEGVLTRPIELEDGRLLVNLVPRETLRWGGDVVAVDAVNYIAANQPTNDSLRDPGQTSLVNVPVDTAGELPSLGGYFHSAYPLYDGTERLLVSWSQCRLIDPATALLAPCTEALISAGAEQAPPAYGLWIYDTRSGTQLPVKLPQDGLMYTDAVVLAPRPVPTAWRPQEIDSQLVDEEVGVVHIRSIYDRDGEDIAPGGITAIASSSPDTREARFLRIVKNVPIPDEDVLDFDQSAFGVSRGAQGMRDILGYVPIEPDGSAKFKVPADMPFMLDIVDARGKRVGGRHQNWLHLRPGEVRECTGCHTSDSQRPHGRRDAEAGSVNSGAEGGIPFPNTQLRDENGIPQPYPMFGESMAEYHARIYDSARVPSMDIVVRDEWTNAANATPGSDINLRYVDIETALNTTPSNCAPLETAPPRWTPPTGCTTPGSWESRCRITIHYIDHIHPLWEADRRNCDALGNVVEDRTCTACHTQRDQDGLAVVPAGQLELTGETSADRPDYITSYAELMFGDNAQEVVENSLTDILVERPTGLYELDAEGNLVLDENGEPIPIIRFDPIPVQASMSTAGARNSNRFFQRFEQNNPNYTVQHVGFLSPAELKLIAEWLDIGGQYYNDPFVAPAD